MQIVRLGIIDKKENLLNCKQVYINVKLFFTPNNTKASLSKNQYQGVGGRGF